MRVDAFDFELPPERIALEPASPRDSARMLVVGADGALTDSCVSDLPDFCATAMRWSSTTRASSPRGSKACASGATLPHRSKRRSSAVSTTAGGGRWFAPPRSSRSASASGSASRMTPGSVCSQRSTRRSKRRARRARSCCASISRAPRSMRRSNGSARRRCRPISRRDARPARRTGPTIRRCSRPNPGRSRRRPRASISRLLSSSVSPRAASRLHRVTLHVGAGTFLPVKVEDTEDHAMHAEEGSIDAATAAALNAVRARRRTHRLRRHDLGAHPRERRGRRGPHPALRRRDLDFHHARLSLPRRRRADDQFPSAAFDACHAGERLQRPRCDPQGLCARDRGRLSLLLLRRRLPADRRARRAQSAPRS